MNNKDNVIVPVIISLSVIIPIAVAALMLLPDSFKLEIGFTERGTLPFFHAILNGSTAVLLLTGFFLIKGKNIKWHKISMLSAFVLSAIFLVSYVIAKISTPSVHYPEDAPLRYVYYFILITHILLSVPVLPLAMFAIYRGITGEITRHKKIVKFAFPVWLYVAITGVLVYVFMSPHYV